MSELERLEKQLDDLYRQMCDAYDADDMERWYKLRAEYGEVGKHYRALLGEEDGT